MSPMHPAATGPGGKRSAYYEFTYPSAEKDGVEVTQKLLVDKQAGLVLWHKTNNDPRQQLPSHGGMWFSQDMKSLNFSQQVGQPDMEELNAWRQTVVENKATIDYWFDLCVRFVTLCLNPCSVSFAVAIALANTAWKVFPMIDKDYDMSVGADLKVLGIGTWLSITGVLLSLFKFWWAGLFHCSRLGCARESEPIFGFNRLPPEVYRRWRCQRLVTSFGILLFFAWCAFGMVMFPLAISRTQRSLCTPVSNVEVGACYKQRGVEKLCGVGGCSCGASMDLTCAVPPAPPADSKKCTTVQKPLCSADGSGTSGVHLQLIVLAVGFSVVAPLYGITWLLLEVAMFRHWFGGPSVKRSSSGSLIKQASKLNLLAGNQKVNTSVSFTSFRVKVQSMKQKLQFQLSDMENPNAVAIAVLPLGTRNQVFHTGPLPSQPATEVAEPVKPPEVRTEPAWAWPAKATERADTPATEVPEKESGREGGKDGEHNPEEEEEEEEEEEDEDEMEAQWC